MKNFNQQVANKKFYRGGRKEYAKPAGTQVSQRTFETQQSLFVVQNLWPNALDNDKTI